MLDIKIDRLKGLMVERHVTQEALSMALGINRSTLSRKLKDGGNKFTIDEIKKMQNFIPLTNEEVIDIFFNRKSRINATKTISIERNNPHEGLSNHERQTSSHQ